MGKDTFPQKLLSLADTAKLLGMSQEKVEELAQRGQLETYRIGGTYLRFKQAQVESLKEKLVQAKPGVKKANVRKSPKVVVADNPSLGDRLKDFWYFNNFYIISAAIIAILIILILR